MNRLRFSVGLLIALTAALPLRSAMAAPARAVWVWNTAAIRGDAAEQDRFFRFLAAPHGKAENAVGVIYVDGVSAKQFQEPGTAESLRRFLANAHARKLRVDFLCGDASWATANGRADGLGYLRAVLAFNRNAGDGGRFDGFQYDVEPYLLPGWPSEALEQGMLGLLDDANAAIASSGRRLILTAAIPRWYGQPQFHYLDRGIVDRTDEVAVMDYVTEADRLVNDPADVLQYAARVHKRVWIGVETGALRDTPSGSFFGAGDGAMEGVLSEAAPRFERSPSFAGYAIHDFASYRDLGP